MDRLPLMLRLVHDGAGTLTLAGTAQVWRSANPIARLLCDAMRLLAARGALWASGYFRRGLTAGAIAARAMTLAGADGARRLAAPCAGRDVPRHQPPRLRRNLVHLPPDQPRPSRSRR
ncbi:hypothetical protein [Sphingomonas bacterium]|uniref:hypothetical protein n=1 Tax=Sphingomonas bacterium TaxID=1895847 RepID=UPI0015766CFB|nr:hypothetical protein [Sphingomonas bacterium]